MESDCCAWATWTIEARVGALVLGAASAGAGIGALHAMFTGLPGLPAATGR